MRVNHSWLAVDLPTILIVTGGTKIANEIIFTEMKFRKVSADDLAETLGITKQTLMQLLRFELDEQEQIKMLLLINNIS